MNLPIARLGFYLLLSVIAVAAVAGGLARVRGADEVAQRKHACWGASAG